ncbi:hypothetical protein J4Q44_G00055550 [Coregonus suidteri]|uniref:Uncharacterized protein n=1 Tax=Coregonus suidteri TaxID=861788 RepID=A0AAN8MCH5_9TELE
MWDWAVTLFDYIPVLIQEPVGVYFTFYNDISMFVLLNVICNTGACNVRCYGLLCLLLESSFSFLLVHAASHTKPRPLSLKERAVARPWSYECFLAVHSAVCMVRWRKTLVRTMLLSTSIL